VAGCGWAGRVTGVVALLVYVYGFSAAYMTLDAGLGALVLFAVVQITMFAGALVTREPVPPRRFAGAGLALAGLAWMLWPVGAVQVGPVHAAMMAAAGVGWGIYSLAGRGGADPLRTTAANFVLAAPAGLLVGFAINPAAAMPGVTGIALAVLSGAVTSGLGYALWYAVLPRLAASAAAVAQLSVPVIALAGGIAFLGEALSPRLALAAALVMAGVALAALPARRG